MQQSARTWCLAPPMATLRSNILQCQAPKAFRHALIRTKSCTVHLRSSSSISGHAPYQQHLQHAYNEQQVILQQQQQQQQMQQMQLQFQHQQQQMQQQILFQQQQMQQMKQQILQPPERQQHVPPRAVPSPSFTDTIHAMPQQLAAVNLETTNAQPPTTSVGQQLKEEVNFDEQHVGGREI